MEELRKMTAGKLEFFLRLGIYYIIQKSLLFPWTEDIVPLDCFVLQGPKS